MKISVTGLTAAAVICLWSGIAAADCVPWNRVQGDVFRHWSKTYPREKIARVEKGGASSLYEKLVTTGRKVRGKDGAMHEVIAKTRFCGQPVKVTAVQGGKRVLFNITAIYRQSGGAFIYDTISVGESSREAGAGKEPPSNEEARKMIIEAYLKKAGNVTKVTSINLSKLKFGSADDRWWYDFDLDVDGIRDDGEKCRSKRCSGSIFRGVMNEQGKDPNAPWAVDISINGCY